MRGGICYEVLVTDPAGETETMRHESKDDARLEVERIRRFHPHLTTRMELVEEPISADRKRLFSADAPRDEDPANRLVCCSRGLHVLRCHLCGRRAVAPLSERDPDRDCPECGSVMLWEARECSGTSNHPGHGRYDANGPVRERPPSFEPGSLQGSLF